MFCVVVTVNGNIDHVLGPYNIEDQITETLKENGWRGPEKTERNGVAAFFKGEPGKRPRTVGWVCPIDKIP